MPTMSPLYSLFSLVTIFNVHSVSAQTSNPYTFSVSLYRNVASANPSDNVFISPFSTEAALSMAYAGAGGATAAEMAKSLGLPSDRTKAVDAVSSKYAQINNSTESGYILRSANALFLDKKFTIKPTYKDIIQNKFGSSISSVDFATQTEAARKNINSFVANKTDNKIPDLFSSGDLDPSTKLVIVNAVFFQSRWSKTFWPEMTKSDSFKLADASTKYVKFMQKESFYHYYNSQDLNAQVLELPYMHGDISMVIVLPKASTTLKDTIAKLDASKFALAISSLQTEKVTVYLPKFKMSKSYPLSGALQALGIKTAFTDSADFSGMSTGGNVKISKVVQKTFVEVDEEGTTAAAATGIQIVAMSGMFSTAQPIEFKANRPFLFFIRHVKTNAVLFMGHIMDPSKQ